MIIYKKILVSVSLNELFEAAKQISAVIGGHTRTKTGEAQEPFIAIREEDRVVWDLIVRPAADKVYGYLSQTGMDVRSYEYNVSPVAINDTIKTKNNTPVEVDIRNNDITITGLPYTYSLLYDNGGAKYGKASISQDGKITYAPYSFFSGTDLVRYTVKDFEGFIHVGKLFVIVEKTAGETIQELENPPSIISPQNQFGSIDNDKIIRFKLSFHEDWDENLKQSLATDIFTAILRGGLTQWFKDTAQFDAMQLNQNIYNETLEHLKSNANKRKYPGRRPHVTF